MYLGLLNQCEFSKNVEIFNKIHNDSAKTLTVKITLFTFSSLLSSPEQYMITKCQVHPVLQIIVDSLKFESFTFYHFVHFMARMLKK